MDDKKLQELYELTKQNNAMLKSMHRSQRIARWFSVFYYLVVFGITAAAFWYIQPVLDGMLKTISAFGSPTGEKPTINFSIPPEYKQLIEEYLQKAGR